MTMGSTEMLDFTNHIVTSMYNIIQLREKELGELQEIAKELGIKKITSLEKDDLVYKILDVLNQTILLCNLELHCYYLP